MAKKAKKRNDIETIRNDIELERTTHGWKVWQGDREISFFNKEKDAKKFVKNEYGVNLKAMTREEEPLCPLKNRIIRQDNSDSSIIVRKKKKLSKVI